MANISKEELFEKTPVPIAVAKLSVPTVISSLVMIFYNMADTYFVGLLNMPVQTAAVTLAAPVLLAFNAVNNLFGIGSSSMMSRALGRKDIETVHRSSAIGFYGSLLSAAFFSLLCTVFNSGLLKLIGTDAQTYEATKAYLFWTVQCGAVPAILNVVMAYMIRAEGATLNAGIGTMSGCILNIILDPVFILPQGLNMGSAGAGLATFISNCFAVCYFLLYIFIKKDKTVVSISPKSVKPDKTVIKEIMYVGVPASIQNLLNVVGSTVLNNIATPFGAVALAAMGICSKINMVPMFIASGISQGIMPLVSYNYSYGNHKRMKSAILVSACISESILVIAAVGMFVFSKPLVSAFIDDAATVSLGAEFMKGFCIVQPFLAMDFLAVGVFQATGLGKESLVFAILRKVVFEIPLIFILNRLYPLNGLPYSQVITEILMSAIAVIALIKLMKKLTGTENKLYRTE